MKTERKTVASEEKVPDDCIFLSFDQTQLEKTLEIKCKFLTSVFKSLVNKLRESLEKKRAREKESQKRSEQLVCTS